MCKEIVIQQAEKPCVNSVHTPMKQKKCISITTDYYSCLGELSDWIRNSVSAKSISSTSIHEVQLPKQRHVTSRIPYHLEKLSVTQMLNPLNAELNPIFYLLALLRAHHFLNVSRIRVKSLTFRRLMSYIYGAPILDVSRSHTTTHHSR